METLRYVLLTNGLLAVVSLAYFALLRRETFFGANRLALWLGLAASLGMPLLELPDWRPQPVKTVMQRTAQVIVPKVLLRPAVPQPEVTITYPNGQTYPAFAGRQAQSPVWSWQMALVMLYGFGVLLLLLRFCGQLLSLRQLIRRSAHGLYDDFTLVRSREVTSPFSFFGWVILNPDRHTADELEQILRHERVHVRAGHSVDMLGAELVCILLWFNPAAYLFRHLLHQTLEFSADRAVLAEGVDARAYQYNLVKVSLAGGHAGLTNPFSRSQLKSRIRMLNQPTSARIAWLKYPVMGLAALSLATAFARHNDNTPKHFIRPPVAETIAPVTKAATANPPSIAEPTPDAATTPERTEAIPEPTALPTDSVNPSARQDSTRVSPSRYMVYEGDYLYWIVTPKTTFDDFAVMKKEFEKQGHVMQLNEVKYDPLYAFIDRIGFTVKRPTGGMTNCKETDDDTQPIPTIAGYIGIGPKLGGSGTGDLSTYKNEFPERLRNVAAEDEKAVAQFIKDHKLDYLIQEGEQKFKDLGSGATTYPKAVFQKAGQNTGLVVNPDGSLSVKEELGAVKVFVNNEAINRATLSQIKADRVYSVVKKSQYNPAKKESFTSALLIYTTQDK